MGFNGIFRMFFGFSSHLGLHEKKNGWKSHLRLYDGETVAAQLQKDVVGVAAGRNLGDLRSALKKQMFYGDLMVI
jgi:hypothetical protein